MRDQVISFLLGEITIIIVILLVHLLGRVISKIVDATPTRKSSNEIPRYLLTALENANRCMELEDYEHASKMISYVIGEIKDGSYKHIS
jgi:hypothetical protein